MTSNRNIVLTGFMGTGKSTVGQLLADALGRRFVDMDVVLAAQYGKPISAVFAEEGEDHFRAAEALLCRTLAGEQGLIISTGGGALVNAENRAALAESGVIVCLMASEDEILRRLASTDDRPLLAGEESQRRARVRSLLHQRRTVYGAFPAQVDTDGLEPGEVAERVLAAVEADNEAPGLIRIPVNAPGGDYSLWLGDGALTHAGKLMAARELRTGRAAIVTNHMLRQHADTLVASLRAADFDPVVCLVPEGEQYKTLETVRDIYDQFLAAGLDRVNPIIALGGGVIGDMAGFAAATYLRGAPFIQAPTSLLSMVDASVGGKTGVDMPQGKNLVGAFKQPELVLMDTTTFTTLPSEEFQSGLAEVVKHGIIGAPRLFEQLEDEGPTSLVQLVAEAVRVKVRVVEADPYEKGVRAVLNLGHTFGHALELVSQFSIRHGEAVAVGTAAAAAMAAELEICSPHLAARITGLLSRLGLPVSAPGYSVDAIYAAMAHDKKRAGKKLRFVVPRDLGDVIVIDDPGEDVVQRAIERFVL